MAIEIERAQKKSLDAPDETRSFERGRGDIVTLGNAKFVRATVEPGWRWSEHVKPVAGSDLCQASHIGYQVAGRLKVVTADGSEFELRPGDAYVIPPGHDAWVVGDEPVVNVDFASAPEFAKPR